MPSMTKPLALAFEALCLTISSFPAYKPFHLTKDLTKTPLPNYKFLYLMKDLTIIHFPKEYIPLLDQKLDHRPSPQYRPLHWTKKLTMSPFQ